MSEDRAPSTTRSRAGLALFAAVFGFGDAEADMRADGGDRTEDD